MTEPTTRGLGTTSRRLRAGVAANVRQFIREPVNVALLVLVPIIVIELYAATMAAVPDLPFVQGNPAISGRVHGALFSTAFLAGLVGLFQERSAHRADSRLIRCGFPRTTLLTARLATIGLVIVVAGAVSLATVWRVAAPADLTVAVAALALAGATYGLVGVLVGTHLRELEGSLVLVFLADLDTALTTGVAGDHWALSLVPLHHAGALFEAGMLGGNTGSHVLPALGYVAVLLAIVVAVYTHQTTTRGWWA